MTSFLILLRTKRGVLQNKGTFLHGRLGKFATFSFPSPKGSYKSQLSVLQGHPHSNYWSLGCNVLVIKSTARAYPEHLPFGFSSSLPALAPPQPRPGVPPPGPRERGAGSGGRGERGGGGEDALKPRGSQRRDSVQGLLGLAAKAGSGGGAAGWPCGQPS